MMYDFGADRVLEPKGYIPTGAWKLDNSREISEHEIRIRVTAIKLEELNFRQLCNECNYDDKKIAARLTDIVKKRGKIHNPISDSAGICCGHVDAIGRDYRNPKGLSVGDEVICVTSMTSIPLFLEAIHGLDFNHGFLEVEGYVIAFESSNIIPFPKGLDATYTLVAMDEIGSLKKASELTSDKKRILILGDGLLTMLFYAAAVRRAAGPDGYVIAVMDQASIQRIG